MEDKKNQSSNARVYGDISMESFSHRLPLRTTKRTATSGKLRNEIPVQRFNSATNKLGSVATACYYFSSQ